MKQNHQQEPAAKEWLILPTKRNSNRRRIEKEICVKQSIKRVEQQQKKRTSSRKTHREILFKSVTWIHLSKIDLKTIKTATFGDSFSSYHL